MPGDTIEPRVVKLDQELELKLNLKPKKSYLNPSNLKEEQVLLTHSFMLVIKAQKEIWDGTRRRETLLISNDYLTLVI